MQVQTRLIGTSALLMHNPQLADPDHEITKAIKKISAKRSKTDDDRHAMERLEHAGGLYVDSGGPYVPVYWLARCFEEAAKVRKLGAAVLRALVYDQLQFPLIYEGPRDPDGLYALPRFQHRATIVVSRRRIVRMRPQFPEWELVATWELLTDVLNYDDFAEIVELSGRMQGIGDGRKLGYGRFVAKVESL
jgi:hypothetical protein